MIFEHRHLTISEKSLQRIYKPLKNVFEKGKMGLSPSPHIAGNQFARHGEEDFNHPADTELPNPVRPLQLRISGLDSRTDFITLFPWSCLLIGIYLISQSQFCGNLQSEVADCVPRLTAALAMVECANRALIQKEKRGRFYLFSKSDFSFLGRPRFLITASSLYCF